MPAGTAKTRLRALQVSWYRKIKEMDPTWVDIERYVDLADYPGRQTLPDVGHVPFNEGMETQGLGGSDVYEYWTHLRHAAYALPESREDRLFLIDVAESGEVGILAKKHKMTRWTARCAWERFVKGARRA